MPCTLSCVDELEEKIGRAVSEIEAALGEQNGALDFEFEYADEITAAGDRVGFVRLAVEFLKVATPAAGSSSDHLPIPDDGRFKSPVVWYRRTGCEDVPDATMSLKDRLLAIGCVLFGAFAVIAFFRGCVALQGDVERFLK